MFNKKIYFPLIITFFFSQILIAQVHINSSGDVGVGTETPNEKLTVEGNLELNGRLLGGLGAKTTGGTTDWNHITNIKSGSGYTLLLGSHSNGPDGSGYYYHPFNFEYGSKNGNGNITQFAIPYGHGEAIDKGGMHVRGRYSGAWSEWRKIISEGTNGSIGIGTSSSSNNAKIDLLTTEKLRGIYSEVQFTGDWQDQETIYSFKGLVKDGPYNTGVFGKAENGHECVGIYGDARGSYKSYGVRAYASGTAGNNYGVYSYAQIKTNSYAGYFSGDLVYTGTSWDISDGAVKKDIKDISNAIDKIKLLKPKKYKFKQDTKMNLSKKENYGLIAQDLEQIFPELVETISHPLNNDEEHLSGSKESNNISDETVELKAISYKQIIPILIQGMQEQQEIIEDLQKRVEQLEKK